MNHHVIHILYFHPTSFYFLQIKVCLPKNTNFFANFTKPISKPCEFPQWVHLVTICIMKREEDGEKSVTWDFTLWKYSCSCLHIYMTKFSVQEFPPLLSFCVFQRFFVTLNSIIVSLDMIIRVRQKKKEVNQHCQYIENLNFFLIHPEKIYASCSLILLMFNL